MEGLKLLDCTIRDGGYYTQWDFQPDLVTTYLESFNHLPYDYLEIGYKSTSQKEYLGEYFYCPLHVLRQIRAQSNKKIAIMLNEKDINPQEGIKLLSPCRELVDMVRIAIDPQNLGRGMKLASSLHNLGFEVALNVMYMSKWKQYPGFLQNLRFVSEVADYFYLVDSYGGVYPKDVSETFQLVKEFTDCKLGFHGHNNLELALINTLTAIENGAEIIDTTITGMGRGPGNLKTELLLTVFSAIHNLEVDFNALSKTVDAFSELQKQHEWGTNLPYMVSGANSLPQKDVMEWVITRFYSYNSIIRALQNQKSGKTDNEQFPQFQPHQKWTKVLIIGGGPTAEHHQKGIIEFLKMEKDVCIIHASSKNAAFYKDLEQTQFFALVGNEGYRLEKVFENMHNFIGYCILPAHPRKMGTYIPSAISNKCFELATTGFTEQYADSHTAIALQAALALGANEIALIGYDGYQENLISQKERCLIHENEYLFNRILTHTDCQLYSLTPTNYKELDVISTYSIII